MTDTVIQFCFVWGVLLACNLVPAAWYRVAVAPMSDREKVAWGIAAAAFFPFGSIAVFLMVPPSDGQPVRHSPPTDGAAGDAPRSA
jgi:hypothetical protein